MKHINPRDFTIAYGYPSIKHRDHYREVLHQGRVCRRVCDHHGKRPARNPARQHVRSRVLPLYPALVVICQKIGKYDVVCEELGMIRDNHERTKEKYQ